jgi:hypothetical protein
MASFATIAAGTQGISSMLVCRLARRADNALDTYNGQDVALLEFDIHFQVDGLGSDQEAVKNY